MKKVYFYFAIPLLMLAVFAVYYVQFHKEMVAREQAAAREAAIQAEKEKQQQLEYQKEQAAKAKAEAEKQRAEEAAKQAKKEAEEKAWNDLNDQYDKMVQKRDEAAQNSYDLSATLRDEQDLLQRAESKMERLKEEQSFLERYLPAVTANRDRMMKFLQDIKNAEEAAALAQQQAAAANNKRK